LGGKEKKKNTQPTGVACFSSVGERSLFFWGFGGKEINLEEEHRSGRQKGPALGKRQKEAASIRGKKKKLRGGSWKWGVPQTPRPCKGKKDRHYGVFWFGKPKFGEKKKNLKNSS